MRPPHSTPWSFYEAVQFFPSYSNLDKVLVYSVLGGIPYYLKQFDPDIPIGENIKANILGRGSILYSEVEFLMRQELRETSVYNTIIGAVALGNTRLNDIFQKTQIEKTKLTVYLKNLTDLGIMRREFPVADGIKRQANVQRGLYQISDHFFRFWYAFVFPNMSELETGDAQGIYRHVVQPSLERYASHAYEDACREYLRRLNRQDKLPFHFTRIGRWWEKGTEIDILAADQEGKHYLVGECKFKTSPFDLADLNAPLGKFRPDKRAARVYYCLFSRSGFTNEVRKAAKDQGIELVELDRMV